jgi:predicted MFS family arabinose efflux permease
VATAPVEKKVKAATSAAMFVGLAVALLNWGVGDSELMGTLPSWVQALMSIAVPPLITFLTAWQASHTPRPDTGDALTPEK